MMYYNRIDISEVTDPVKVTKFEDFKVFIDANDRMINCQVILL